MPRISDIPWHFQLGMIGESFDKSTFHLTDLDSGIVSILDGISLVKNDIPGLW